MRYGSYFCSVPSCLYFLKSLLTYLSDESRNAHLSRQFTLNPGCWVMHVRSPTSSRTTASARASWHAFISAQQLHSFAFCNSSVLQFPHSHLQIKYYYLAVTTISLLKCFFSATFFQQYWPSLPNLAKEMR